MKRSLLVSADRLVSVAVIAGDSPRGCDVQVHKGLGDAIAASPQPRLSFSGVRTVGNEFVTKCLAPVLFEAARAGRPVLATEIDREVAKQLHSGLRSVGALLPHGDTAMALGASSQLVETLALTRRGRDRAATLAASLGITELAAASRLGLLAHWGLIVPDSRSRETDLAIAA